MDQEEAQRMWEEYYQRKKSQRLDEAVILWQQVSDAGINEDTVLALDFLLFGTNEENAQSLYEQLSENYEMKIYPSSDKETWYVEGTTRPYGINLAQQQHYDWVDFMCDVAQSYDCVFSTWALESPKLNLKFESESIESAS